MGAGNGAEHGHTVGQGIELPRTPLGFVVAGNHPAAYNASEGASSWGVAEIVVWDRELSDLEIETARFRMFGTSAHSDTRPGTAGG